MSWGSGGWGSSPWGSASALPPLVIRPTRVDIGLFVYAPVIRRAVEFSFSPESGATPGGDEIVFRGSALDMSACTPALNTLTGWTSLTQNSGAPSAAATGIYLSTGNTPGSFAGIRSPTVGSNIDVSVQLQTERVTASSGVLAELALYVSSDTRFVVQVRSDQTLQLTTTLAGQTTTNQTIGGAARNPQIRLLRFSNNVLVFAGGEVAALCSWTDALAHTEVITRNAGTSPGTIDTLLTRYVRRPVITFAGEPVTTLRQVSSVVAVGGLPTAQGLLPKLVDVGVTGCQPGEDLAPVQFQYTNPFTFQVGQEPQVGLRNRLVVLGEP